MTERHLTYAEAIREAFAQLLESDPDVFVIGQGLWSPWYVGNSMTDLDKKFGRDRIIDSPVSENATTGAAIGAAVAGMRPIVVHPRMDFMLLATDQIVNQAANWSYMFSGKTNVPVVIRPIINRGGEQGAQHSQSVHAWFSHVPGLKVVMPSNPYDAKGLLISSVYDEGPVLYLDDRWLYDESGPVPEEIYRTPIGKAFVRREGEDISIVASSFLTQEALAGADLLAKDGISAEVIDIATTNPIDQAPIVASVLKTGRLLVADGGWAACGISAEVGSIVAESEAAVSLKQPIKRLSLPNSPAPTSRAEETAYFVGKDQICSLARALCLDG